jgi:hypothetical protein
MLFICSSTPRGPEFLRLLYIVAFIVATQSCADDETSVVVPIVRGGELG